MDFIVQEEAVIITLKERIDLHPPRIESRNMNSNVIRGKDTEKSFVSMKKIIIPTDKFSSMDMNKTSNINMPSLTFIPF